MTERNPYILRVSRDHVMVPARIAALLEREADLSSVRVRLRGVDPEASQVLEAIRETAMDWRSCAFATAVEGSAQPVRDSGMTTSDMVTSKQVADQLRLSGQAIRKAIADGRLPAEKVGGQWLINREDVAHFKAARAA